MKSGMGALAIMGIAAGAALGQPATAIRFNNGTSAISVAPGTMVHVEVYATGLPDVGTPIPWTTPPGTGQIGGYEGFLSVLFDVRGQTLGTAVWSGLGIAPGDGFMNAIPEYLRGPT